MTDWLNIVLIGTGSIGRRHAENIRRLRPSAKFQIVREQSYHDAFSRSLDAVVAERLDELNDVDAAIVASPSSVHMNVLRELISRRIPVYIEKPIVTNYNDLTELEGLLRAVKYQAPSMVGCNLRFLPSLIAVRQLIQEKAIGRIVRVSLEAGQWLPDWRPQHDYRRAYSARRALGGGVIFDLIHEIDVVAWMFGDFTDVLAVSRKLSDLEIETSDVASIVLSRDAGPLVTIQLDYISRLPVRRYSVVGDRGSITWDLGRKELRIDGPQGTTHVERGPDAYDVSATYVTAMEEFISAVEERRETTNSIADGLTAVRMAIAAHVSGL